MSDKDRQDLCVDDPDLLVKEQAVHQHRNWVRTTYSCNNRCIFCLDGDVPPRGHIEESKVRADIESGFRDGARLILSGGEASIHPSFLDFISYGKSLGYSWIQTISNGRMFAYGDFAKKAADAGLNEVTFSMHGHNAKLHDELTGVSGGFAQALRGMINLLKDGRVVVNVDCVINALNYRQMDEILEFYQTLGVHEFDLLQIVPFGRAWWPENRERLFYDVEAAYPYLNRAFRRVNKPENHVWTNRFPVSYLEGIEELIQDPHKLFDEMRGRREEFEHFIDSGEMLACYGERCDYCFLKDYCGSLVQLREMLEKCSFDAVNIDLTENPAASSQVLEKLLTTKNVRRWRLAAADVTEFIDWLEAAPKSSIKIDLKLEDWNELREGWASTRVREAMKRVGRLVCADPVCLNWLIDLPFELEIMLTRETEPVLNGLKESLSQRRDIVIAYPSVETLSEAVRMLPEPRAFFETWKEGNLRSRGVPYCIHPNPDRQFNAICLSSLDKGGRIDLSGFTRDYIRFGYHAKSNGCRDCTKTDQCPGLAINSIRVHGFERLKPIARKSPTNDS